MAELTPELEYVVPLRMSAARHVDEGGSYDAPPIEPFIPTIAFEFSFGNDPDRFGASISVTAETNRGTFDVKVFGVFTASDHAALTDEELDPVLRQALSLVFPFARSEIADITGRVLGHTIMAPLLDVHSASINLDFRGRPKKSS